MNLKHSSVGLAPGLNLKLNVSNTVAVLVWMESVEKKEVTLALR